MYDMLNCAGVAQSVEQLIRNQQIVGSSPITSSTSSRTSLCPRRFFVNVAFMLRRSSFPSKPRSFYLLTCKRAPLDKLSLSPFRVVFSPIFLYLPSKLYPPFPFCLSSRTSLCPRRFLLTLI